MERNHSMLKMTLGYVVVFLLLACNSSDKKSKDSIKIMDNVGIDRQDIPIVEKIDTGSQSDTIIISGMQFRPAELHIKKGATVVWVNRDIVVHDATEFPDKKWTSGPLNTGNSWKMKVDKSYDYFCSIHITMKGKVTVDP